MIRIFVIQIFNSFLNIANFILRISLCISI
ncbi:hypothetical protein CY0110_17117 [Crocosphaera chwakensis CCY0110]|uniref:Uncharacterized protein n=1 Tax=Crocosphaera chwakensis CCY0110 TaxID=391612 RepID=A3IIA5_9CHRO|nr:hypothetical protein CY0110_17117 [Crocosphaera chwakensis CCY0110]